MTDDGDPPPPGGSSSFGRDCTGGSPPPGRRPPVPGGQWSCKCIEVREGTQRSGGARQAYPRKPVLDGGFLVQFIRVKGCLRQALAQTIRECPFPILPRTKNNLVGCYGSRWGARLGNQPRGTLLAVYPQSPCGGLSEEASECQAPPGVRPWVLTSVPPISGK